MNRLLARLPRPSPRPPSLFGPDSAETNGFFCALLRSARTRPGCWLDEWWSERHCAREWGEAVRPGGYGVWTEHRVSLPFLLEYDSGTVPLARLAGKLGGYHRLAQAAGSRVQL